ncbi:unnamed protein product [Lactuca saligna]|uniref:Uncharacterized protein n=1 Tax=Lactuca saligna TaxID=75948 RepID=A0AA35Z1H4_LACSI|nr:unnamed protein product [Lactuca saligna]
MTDEAAGEPLETPHSPIHLMVSLETTNTSITPPPQTTGVASEAPPSNGSLPSLATVAPYVTTQIPIPTLNSVNPPLLPNNDKPNPPISPPITLIFSNINVLNNVGYSFLQPPIHTTNEQQQTTLITPPLNGMPSLMHTTPVNKTANGPSIIFQAQNYPSLVTGSMPARHSRPTSKSP